jgi:alkylation response protein AidB-like acyl-CoA dehydrogenase
MDFQLSEDQEALRDGIRTFCEGQFSIDTLRELEEKSSFDRGLWRELAEMGVFALRLEESEGGVGLGLADAVLVFAELGRRLVPGPTVWSHLLAGTIEGAATGDSVVGGLSEVGEGPIVVEHLDHLDALVVLREDGVYRIDPKGLEGTPIQRPLDPLTPIHHLKALPTGDKIGDTGLAATIRRDGAVLASALLLGIAEVTQELATDYAKGREQFGRPIGGFQAIKHMLADMYVRQELCRSIVYAAGATVDTPEVGSVSRAVAAAKVMAGEAALKMGGTGALLPQAHLGARERLRRPR